MTGRVFHTSNVFSETRKKWNNTHCILPAHSYEHIFSRILLMLYGEGSVKSFQNFSMTWLLESVAAGFPTIDTQYWQSSFMIIKISNYKFQGSGQLASYTCSLCRYWPCVTYLCKHNVKNSEREMKFWK